MDEANGRGRPRRSVLYAPASNARALASAAGLASDVVVLDLEDSVAVEAKGMARDQAAAAVAERRFGEREVVVRINGPDTPWAEADFAAAVAAGADAILLPKVSGPADVERWAAAGAPLWAMIETCAGALGVREIARAATGTPLAAMVFGGNDLALEMRLRPAPDRAPMQPFLSMLVAAARESGLVALDGVFNGLDDLAGFEAECAQGAAFGFDGKTLIHPSQIEPCNRHFSPTPQEAAWARAVVAAFAAPEAADKGALRLQGRMVERLHLKDAERVLRLLGA